jgi:hypothetical protein
MDVVTAYTNVALGAIFGGSNE